VPYVVFRVKHTHFVDAGPVGLVYVHFFVEAIRENELVGHFHAERLHGVTRAIVDRPDFLVVEIADPLCHILPIIFTIR
jgi:hypothetical protein